jgi:metal-responsive CopG/Arc/MetJ family transcriptional regulator
VKIAISVPDPVFRRAEQAARRMRVPRSQFYSRAVEAYLRQAAIEDLTERLNAVYADAPVEPDPFLSAAARRTLRRSK